MSTININWDSLHRELTLTATTEGAAATFIQAGYAPNFYSFEGRDTLTISDLEHVDGKPLYLRAVGLNSAGEEMLETETLTSTPIYHPIIGIVKTCDGERNIIDIVEYKNGKVSERFKSGQRVVKIGTVNVNFYVDGELYLTKKVCSGQPMEQPDDPELPEGCELMYWAEEVPDPYEGKFRVTMSPVNGKQNTIVEWVKAGEKATKPADPEPPESKAGCPFHGWYERID